MFNFYKVQSIYFPFNRSFIIVLVLYYDLREFQEGCRVAGSSIHLLPAPDWTCSYTAEQSTRKTSKVWLIRNYTSKQQHRGRQEEARKVRARSCRCGGWEARERLWQQSSLSLGAWSLGPLQGSPIQNNRDRKGSLRSIRWW